MSVRASVCRKSKRVAKRQEDEIFWLMHNFPQGIDYNDLCENTSAKTSTSPPSKTRDLLTSVNDKLNDESTAKAKVALKMPKLLRSGKSLAAQSIAAVDSSNSSITDERAPSIVEEPEPEIPEPKIPEPEIPEPKIPEKPTRRVILTRSKRNVSDVGISNAVSLSLTESRRSAPATLKREAEDEEEGKESDDSLTPEEIAQIERIQQLQEPKFKAGPSKLCTRSGATYAFAWKSKKNKSRKRGSKPSGKSKRSSTNQTTKPTKKPNDSTKDQIADVQVKQEQLDVEEVSPTFVNELENHSVTFPNEGGSTATDPLQIPKTLLKQARTRKRRRLSLLPTQTKDEEVFTSTWLDALNINQAQAPSPLTASPACSRPESPISPVSSLGSESTNRPKRRGRTASLNCRAVLSALMRPEPVRKPVKKSPPKPTSSPKSKIMKVDPGEPSNFFKIKITPTYEQKVEYIQNGLCTKLPNCTNSLRAHETKILTEAKTTQVKTNGWTWKGSHVHFYSFYRESSAKVTRLYFGAMERDGVELRVGDSVALQTHEEGRPFVGKIIAMWQDNLGEMMVTLCWFYRPSDLENIKTAYGTNELYLSKHTDDNSVATIQDKVFVLSFPEYCRYHAYQAEFKPSCCQIVPNVIKWREQVFSSSSVHQDKIYFCRGVYDFRLKRTLKQQLYYTKYL